METAEVTSFIGLEISGVQYADLAQPEVIRQVVDGVRRRELVIIRSVDMTPDQFVTLARRLGRPLPFMISNYRHPDFEEIILVSNEMRDGRPQGIARAGNFWHQDSSFTTEPPTFTMLHGVNVPTTSGHTKFASAIDVYTRLPDEWKQRLVSAIGVHTFRKRFRIRPEHVGLSIAELALVVDAEHPPVQHPIMCRDGYTDRPYVYGAPDYLDTVIGLDRNDNGDFHELLGDLIGDEERVYTHQWTPNDIVLWKTRTTFHMATEVEPGVGRTVHRISIVTDHHGD